MNIKRRNFIGIGVASAATVGLAACGGDGAGSSGSETADSSRGDSGTSEAGGRVGVAMPTQTSERWIADGEAVKSQLEEAGFEVDLQFANDDIPTQSQQIDQMITKGANVLIIAAIDGTALAPQLETAAAQGIKIISYDRLIRDSANVDFYVSFDNFKVGVAQGQSLIDGLAAVGAESPANIELFAGSLDDNNAHFFFDGAMSLIQPKLDDGSFTIPSGQTSIEQVATLRWQQETAQKRMEDLLTSNYGSQKVAGVLSAYDGLSRGIITALQNAGYAVPDMPIVTGQDAEIASVKLITEDVQYSTIFKDTRLLAEQAVAAAVTLLEGNEPEANNTTDYDNGVKVVPSYLLDVVTVTKDNVQEALVDSGYWTAEEVESGVAG
ncbi:MAG: multiple monosaccharide ABC transporter substrate-binding protein [Arachnia sp.]